MRTITNLPIFRQSDQMQQSKTHHFFCQQQAAGPGRYGYDTTGALHEFKFLHVTCQFITGFIVRQRVARHLAALVDFPWVQHFEHAFFPLWKVVGLHLSQVSIFLQLSYYLRFRTEGSRGSFSELWRPDVERGALYAEEKGMGGQKRRGGQVGGGEGGVI